MGVFYSKDYKSLKIDQFFFSTSISVPLMYWNKIAMPNTIIPKKHTVNDIQSLIIILFLKIL